MINQASFRSTGGEMVDVAENILHDYRHGFKRVDEGGSAGTAGIGCTMDKCARGVAEILCGRFLRPDLLIHQ